MTVTHRPIVRLMIVAGLLAGCAVGLVLAEGMSYDDVARMKTVTSATISPDGEHVAYRLSVPRTPYKSEDGAAWVELWVADRPGESRPYVTGKVNVGTVRWTPDGRGIAFLAKRGDDKQRSLYIIPLGGGEAQRKLTHDEEITGYSFSPDGQRVAFLAKSKQDKLKKKLAKKGFKAEIYEEEWRPVKLWIADLEHDEESADDESPRVLPLEGSASEVHWSPAGDKLVVALAPTSLIDDHYMKRRVHVIDVKTGASVARIDNPGKLGQVAFSPDGKRLAMVAAEDLNDPAAGRLMVVPTAGGSLTNLMQGYQGDVVDFAWQDADTILYVAHEGVESVLARVDVDGSGRKTLLAPGGPILYSLSLSDDGASAAMEADSPLHPAEVFGLRQGDTQATRWTDSNPWLAELELASQEVASYEARDGLKIEGVLIRPLHEEPGKRYPLILVVHGGPEAHFSNGWLTVYSRPGQFAAAAGYAVFYPNYRGSTGRGVEYSKLDQADYAGAEFDDLVDGIGQLVESGLVARDKVGVTGGSYGGFASAWCATALTEHFAASVMFVGISDQISKFGTTDIPNEMFEVHSRRWPWDHWDWFRERSPIFHTAQARTPILILHGKDDTRVHPSQSMELYRYLKTQGQVPVRLVFYPGEGHGNRKAAARLDYSRRLMRWMDHYLVGPGGDPPPYALEHEESDLDGDDDDDDDDEQAEGKD